MAFADDDWSPLSDITLALLLERAGIRWKYLPLEGVAEIVWPPICGRHLMFVERHQAPGERRFAIRHGLAHVLAGHVDEISFARDGHDWRGFEESVADLFAIADLVPDRMLREAEEAGLNPVETGRWVQGEIWRYVPNWPDARIQDRAALRLAL